MATRRHLLLVPQSHFPAIANAMSDFTFDSAGGWRWFVDSAVTRSHADLLARVAPAGVPFLLFTTFDSGWNLTAGAASGKVGDATHDFNKDWRAGSKAAQSRNTKLAELIHAVATEADTATLRAILSAQTIEKAEEESDLGNLPRLLHAIGATGIVDIPRDPPPRKDRPAKPTLAQSLIAGHEVRPRAPIEGIALPVEHAADLAALSLYCDPDGVLALIARGDDLPDVTLDVPCQISRLGDALFVEAEGGIGLKANIIHRAALHLAPCDGLVELTILAGRKRGGKDIAWHRYTGSVREHTWAIAEATPAVRSTDLAAALALIAQRRDGGAIPCTSNSEATAVAAACAKSLYFTPSTVPETKGAQLNPAPDTRFYVLLHCFRERFAKTWNTATAQKAEGDEKRQWDRLETQLQESIDRVAAATKDDSSP